MNGFLVIPKGLRGEYADIKTKQPEEIISPSARSRCEVTPLGDRLATPSPEGTRSPSQKIGEPTTASASASVEHGRHRLLLQTTSSTSPAAPSRSAKRPARETEASGEVAYFNSRPPSRAGASLPGPALQ